MSRIIMPGNGTQHVDYHDVSKSKLAKIVNEQSASIRRLVAQNQLLGNILLAIAADPDVLQVSPGGQANVLAEAVDRVPRDSALRVARHDDRLYLTAKGPEDAPRIQQVPNLVVPN